jgi:hypothetical protein
LPFLVSKLKLAPSNLLWRLTRGAHLANAVSVPVLGNWPQAVLPEILWPDLLSKQGGEKAVQRMVCLVRIGFERKMAWPNSSWRIFKAAKEGIAFL